MSSLDTLSSETVEVLMSEVQLKVVEYSQTPATAFPNSAMAPLFHGFEGANKAVVLLSYVNLNRVLWIPIEAYILLWDRTLQ